MSGRTLEITGRKVWILEGGNGAPLLYLHGFADVHSVKEHWLPFHEKLAQRAKVIAPAHPARATRPDSGSPASFPRLCSIRGPPTWAQIAPRTAV